MNLKLCLKRSLCFLLLLSMLVGFLPAQAQAADGSTLINSINDLDAPVSVTNSLKTVTSTNNGELAGTYYIVNHYSDGKTYAIDPLPEASVGRLKATQVTVSNNSVTDGDLSMAIDVEHASGIVYWLYVSDGRYIREQDISKTASIVLGERSEAIGLQLRNGAIRMYRRFSVGTTNDAHNMTNNGTEIYFVKDTGSYTATNTFYFYQITQRWDTSALYSAIMEMASYLSAENTAYAQGIYDKFLSCMEASVTLYKKHNVATDSQTYAQVLEIRKELEAQTQWLLSYKAVLQGDYGTAAEKIPVPNNEMVPFSYGEFQKYQLSNLTEDTYYLVNLLGDGSRGRAVNTGSNFFQSGVGYFHAADVTVENNKLTNADPDWAVYLDVYPDSTNLCIPRPVHNVDITLNGLGEDGISYKFSYGTGQGFNSEADYNAIYLAIHVYDLDGNGNKYNDWSFLTYLPELGGYRPYRNPDHSHTEDNSLTLFRLSTQSVELYKAIRDSARFAAEDADSRYPQSVYEQFLQCLSESIGLYLQYNVDLTGAQEANFSAIKNEMDKKAEELRDYARIMTSADELTEYIDIPVEIFDFRADAHLFEYINGYYGLSGAPGTSSNHGKLDLTEGTLNENRQIAYREAVVDYVVKAFTEASLEGSDLSDKVPGWNDAIYKLMPSVAGDQKLPTGSYDETIEKTTTGANGGDLRWTQVTTYYDLAYYMLTYMWRPVQSGDIMDKTDNLPYNTTVTQRDRLRLYANEKGDYILDTASELVYDGYYIYNSVPRIDTDVELNSPYFQPINGLGFETEEMRKLLGGDTDHGTYFYENGSYVTENTNFHFTLHAYGSFVYYEDQNLYFDFLGDDDVYFFIDGKMALDIGGAHAALGAGIMLNDLKTSHGLVDGEIYTFDMFYAERHTTAANLKFSTNIKIVDTDTLTTKGQYLDTESGVSMVDPATGRGPELIDYAPINVGDTVAYSFDLQNTRDVPVKKVSFSDSTLGVTASHAVVKLNSITRITDLRLYYTTISGGVLDSYDPVVKTESEMEILINTANQLSGSTYGSLPAGCYRVNITSDGMLKNLLALGIPVNCKLSLYGFKRVVTEGDSPYVNTVFSDCLTIDNRLITGAASRVITAFVAPKGKDTTLVLDYGKAIQITAAELKESITIAPGSSVAVGNCVGLTTVNGYSGQLLKVLPSTITKHSGTQGEFSFSSTGITYKPFKFLDGMDRVFAVFSISNCTVTEAGGKTVTYPYILLQLRTVPATSVYYEAESFKSELTYLEKRTDSSGVETFYSDWEEDGAANTIKEEGFEASDDLQAFKSVGQDHPYGYDPSYADDTLLSNGRSLYVEGAGVVVPNAITNENYTQIEFSFVGTGFDIISRTGAQQATIRVSVYDDPGKANDHRIKSITVNNKGELELYQIPVVSVQGLEHGTYYVSLWVNDKITGVGFPQLPGVDLSGLTRGNEFYLDAIRIYDPIDVSGDVLFEDQTIALDAYKADKEAYNYIKEIRNILLSKENFDTLEDTLAGAVFVDMETTPEDIVIQETDSEGETTGETTLVKPEGVEVTDHVTAKVQTYNKVGPKNEVYLAPGQAVAFRLAVDTLQPIVSLDVGAKTIEASSRSKLTVGFVSDTNGVEGKASFNLATATAQYYAIDAENIRSLTADSSKAVYFVIYNDTEGDKGENVISITDIKVAYEGKPTIQPPADSPTDPEIKRGIWEETPPVRFLVDRNAATAAETFLKAILAEPPAEEEPPVEEPPVEEPPIVAEGIRILHSLNLASDISINYAVPKAELAGYENVVMTCTLPVYEGDGLMDLRQLTLLPVEQGDYLYFTLTGMTAVNMNDTVEAVLSMTKEGRDYTTAVDTYSVAQYAYAQLNKAYTDRALKVLCADLLRYGAKAQIYKSYRTDALADAHMTDAHRAYLSDLASATFGNTNKVLDDLENAPITWAGKTLNLESKVALKFVFNPANYNGDPSALTLMISYADINGTPKSLSIKDPELYNPDLGLYVFTLDALLAAELRTVVSVQIFAGDIPVSCTLQYSADTYGNGKSGDLLNLCKALMAYSDSAKAYFTA